MKENEENIQTRIEKKTRKYGNKKNLYIHNQLYFNSSSGIGKT